MEGLKHYLCKVSSPQGIIALSLTWDGVEAKGILWYYLVIVIAFVKYEGEGLFAFFSWCQCVPKSIAPGV